MRSIASSRGPGARGFSAASFLDVYSGGNRQQTTITASAYIHIYQVKRRQSCRWNPAAPVPLPRKESSPTREVWRRIGGVRNGLALLLFLSPSCCCSRATKVITSNRPKRDRRNVFYYRQIDDVAGSTSRKTSRGFRRVASNWQEA